jgi:fructose-specific phosphotransferase system component IIB
MAKIVAITGCPTGVGHTYMAADMVIVASQGGARSGIRAVQTAV